MHLPGELKGAPVFRSMSTRQSELVGIGFLSCWGAPELEAAKVPTIGFLTAGHAYWRPAGQEHNVRNVSGKPARAIAVHLDPVR